MSGSRKGVFLVYPGNVKRRVSPRQSRGITKWDLRPVTLGPFDYEVENITPSLWIVEGLTDYYADLILVRAGLSNPTDYIKTLSANISSVQARRHISLTEASLRDWEPGSKLASFYSGGAVVGFLLDQQIRQATDGRASLDDVMRQAYQQYSGEHGYTEEQFETIASQVAGLDFSDFFQRYVHKTEPLDFIPTLRHYGLRFRPGPPLSERFRLGLVTQSSSGRLMIASVMRDSPGEKAGLEKGDELLAVDDAPINLESEFDSYLRKCQPDRVVDLLVARRGQQTRLRLSVDKSPETPDWQLEIDPDATPESRANWEAYLKG